MSSYAMNATHFLESDLPARRYVEDSLMAGAIAGAAGAGVGFLKGWLDRKDAAKRDEEKRVYAERQARRNHHNAQNAGQSGVRGHVDRAEPPRAAFKKGRLA